MPHTLLLSNRPLLVAYCGVIQRNAHSTSVMTIVLSDDALAAELPQARIVVTTGRHQIGAIGAEGAVPDPALMAVQCCFKGEGSGVTLSRSRQLIAGL
jgi:hypothetical protein